MSTEMGTEEELGARVTAYLRAQGLSETQFALEHTVSVQIGRNRIPNVGRLDLLVKNPDGKNLLLAEYKGPGIRLSEGEELQALSYARLQPQMPPLVLLTNGSDNILFDTVTRQRVSDERNGLSEASSGEIRACAEDLRLREEALRLFLGHSQANVSAFCEAQQADRMRGLRGATGSRREKYLPSVYVERPGVRDLFREFLDSRAAVFVLSGPSGVGKSNEMCSLAEESARQHLALFFPAGDLSTNLRSAVEEEFAWTFSEGLALPQLCKRLHALVDESKRRVVLFVDAADECHVFGFDRAVSELARQFAGFEGALKLALSVKETHWPRFAHFGDSDSALARQCFRSPEAEAEGKAVLQPSITLGPWDGQEAEVAFGRYCSHFGVKDDGSRLPANLAPDPLALRVVFELCKDGERSVRDVINEPTHLWRLYLEQKHRKLIGEGRSRQEAALKAVARALLKADSTSPDSVFEGDALEFAPSMWTELPLEPFDGGLLLKHYDSAGRARVSFQYDRVRDHIVAYHVLRLDVEPPETFDTVMEGALASSVGAGALRVYLATQGSSKHATAVRRHARKAAGRLLTTYDHFRSELSPFLRASVEPFTTGSAGLAYSLSEDASTWAYGFFAREPDEKTVHEEQASRLNTFGDPWPPDPPGSIGKRLRVVRHSSAWPMLADPQHFAVAFALKQLQRATKDGCLDETGSRILQVESALVLTQRHRRKLELPRGPRRFSREAEELGFDLIPLDLREIEDRAHGALGAEQAHLEVISRHRFEESDAAMRRARDEARAGKRFSHPPNVRPVPLLATLATLSTQLCVTVPSVVRHHLPTPDQDAPESPSRFGNLDEAYSESKWREFIAQLWILHLDEYKRLVETNLSPVARMLRTYAALPVHVLVCCEKSRDDLEDQIHYAYLDRDVPCPVVPEAAVASSAGGQIQVLSRSAGFHFSISQGEGPSLATPRGPISLGARFSGWSAGRVVCRDSPPFGRNGERFRALMPVRNGVYSMIAEDIESIEPRALIEQAGLAANVGNSEPAIGELTAVKCPEVRFP